MTATSPGRIKLPGTFNVRDVGGVPTTDGRTVNGGLLFRSAHLGRLDDAGRAALDTLGVDTVIDLRSARECEAEGADALPDHIEGLVRPFHQNPVVPTSPGTISPDAAREHLIAVYGTYPALEGAGRAIRAIIESVARGQTVLVHCSAGKDRTGWAVATALRAAGVVEEAIEVDYLRSNDAVEDLRAMLASRYPDADIPADYLGVHTDYLQAADAAMVAAHGDLAGYLAACGVDADTLGRYRERVVG
ncbi:tyrosine-protein phosphatase [Gordonia oryzae]|uniref:Tyrosine-protein phosphatase n=1 Tax=Gordonia oryzae TaxID=2487349 RepID=A0A3N4GUZ7_9ACTN|nr:tyrosine-protein phosphatase [Gordonia oryzae]RPA56794.1 tyrosine-protein phosphatase [Gordonia oryzae]